MSLCWLQCYKTLEHKTMYMFINNWKKHKYQAMSKLLQSPKTPSGPRGSNTEGLNGLLNILLASFIPNIIFNFIERFCYFMKVFALHLLVHPQHEIIF